MNNRHIFKIVTACLVAISIPTHAAPIKWIAETPNKDIDDRLNWDPNTAVPSSADDAIFDSAIPHIETNPTENSAPFTVSNFIFKHNPSVFMFDFNNQTLAFSDVGIIPGTANPIIHVTNTDNVFFGGDLISFIGSLGSTSGSADITTANNASLTGTVFVTTIGAINSNFYSSAPFSISDGGKITASNIGNDSANGIGGNSVAKTGFSQLKFDESFTAANNVSVSALNDGTFSGSNTGQGESVNVCSGSQFVSSGVFHVGDDFSCHLQNTGTNSSTSIGDNHIGLINAAQMRLQSTANVGNNCSITIANTGINTFQSTDLSDYVGYVTDQQFFVENSFQAGHGFELTVTNEGTDTSSGYGLAFVGNITSDSGNTGDQILFKKGCRLVNRSSISASNIGTYNGTNTGGGSWVGVMNASQIAIGDRDSPGSHIFHAEDDFSLSATCIGNDSTQGLGGDVVGNVTKDQITFYTSSCYVGRNAQFNLVKEGFFDGQASSYYINVGSADSQLNCLSTFRAGDGFILNINNTGRHEGIVGSGNDFVAQFTGQQAGFHDVTTLGDDAKISIFNSGSTASNTTAPNQVSSFFGDGKQLLIEGAFQAGKNLEIVISNSGFNESTGAGGGYTACINNNTVNATASQLHLGAGGIVTDGASINLSNIGTYQGNNTSGFSRVAILEGQQFCSAGVFTAGDNFNYTASNTGTDGASGQSDHKIGQVGTGGQFDFNTDCNLGNNASITLSNKGTNNDLTGLLNEIGYIIGSQMRVSGDFSAGTKLNMTATNTAINNGDPSNLVGYIEGSQFLFEQQCQLDKGSSISAFNTGTVLNSQIEFSQGFDILSGKVTIQASNSEVVGFKSIYVHGSSLGGNANIVLENASLYVDTTLPTFTIGELNGDALSRVESNPELIIDTDKQTNANFSGSILNFPLATTSSVTKRGVGTQELSGINAYTGLTSVDKGILILTGSVAGDVTVNLFGALKGNGPIGGDLINYGTVAPGKSIGTLTVLGNYINKHGIYAVEINGRGQSDLINVVGTARLNGGPVVVSSTDGTFLLQHPYTIVTAAEGVTGTYARPTSLAFINPILTYDPNNVYLTIQSALLNAADSCNQFGVARVLDSIINPNAGQTLIINTIANLPLEGAQEALESLSGFQYTHDVWETQISTQRLLRRVYNPLRTLVNLWDSCNPECGWTAWLETGDGFTNVHGKNAHKIDMNSFEMTGGIQKSLCDNLTVGLAGSYEYDNAKYKQGKGCRNTEYLVAYGLYRSCSVYGLVDFVYGHTSNKLSRSIDLDLGYNVHSKPNINTFACYGESGCDLNYGCFLIQPFLGIQTGKNWRNRISESGDNLLGLSIDKHDWSSTSSRLGLHVSTCDPSDCNNVSLDVAWNYLWSCPTNSTAGRFNDFGDTFCICGDRLDKNSLDYALTFSTCFCNGIRGYLELGGESWQHANTFDISGGVTYSW